MATKEKHDDSFFGALQRTKKGGIAITAAAASAAAAAASAAATNAAIAAHNAAVKKVYECVPIDKVPFSDALVAKVNATANVTIGQFTNNNCHYVANNLYDVCGQNASQFVSRNCSSITSKILTYSDGINSTFSNISNGTNSVIVRNSDQFALGVVNNPFVESIKAIFYEPPEAPWVAGVPNIVTCFGVVVLVGAAIYVAYRIQKYKEDRDYYGYHRRW